MQTEIKRKETEAASQHGDGDPSHERLIGLKGHKPQKKGDDCAHARGQTIHAVDEVHRVGKTHDPDYRKGGVEEIAPCRMDREEIEDDSGTDQEDDDKDLYEELVAGTNIFPVIDEPNDSNDRASGNQGDVPGIQDHIGQEGGDKGDDNGHAAEQGSYLGMDLPAPGDIYDTGLCGYGRHDRSEQGGSRKSKNEDIKPATELFKKYMTDKGDQEQEENDQSRQPDYPLERSLP